MKELGIDSTFKVNTPKIVNKTLFVGQKQKLDHKKWVLIDAENLTLGKLAVVVANFLRGKNKACFTPHTDCGDNVIVINTDKVKLSKNKEITKKYYRHTGYPGGLKVRNPKYIRSIDKSKDLVRFAVKGMLSRGPMAYARMRNLHLYSTSEHSHSAQKPEFIDVAGMHKKHSYNIKG